MMPEDVVPFIYELGEELGIISYCEEHCVECGKQCIKELGHEGEHDCGEHKWIWPSYVYNIDETGGAP
jgi:hypothetical protein